MRNFLGLILLTFAVSLLMLNFVASSIILQKTEKDNPILILTSNTREIGEILENFMAFLYSIFGYYGVLILGISIGFLGVLLLLQKPLWVILLEILFWEIFLVSFLVFIFSISNVEGYGDIIRNVGAVGVEFGMLSEAIFGTIGSVILSITLILTSSLLILSYIEKMLDVLSQLFIYLLIFLLSPFIISAHIGYKAITKNKEKKIRRENKYGKEEKRKNFEDFYVAVGSNINANFGFSETDMRMPTPNVAEDTEEEAEVKAKETTREIVPVSPVYSWTEEEIKTRKRLQEEIKNLTMVRNDVFEEEFVEEGEEDIELEDTEDWVESEEKEEDTGIVKTVEARIEEPKKDMRKGTYPPPLDLLVIASPEDDNTENIKKEIASMKYLIERTLETFGINAEIVRISRGPTVTLFEMTIPPGIKTSKVSSLADNIALNLGVAKVRVIAPIPGTKYIGIEVPNYTTRLVTIREIIESPEFQGTKDILPLIIGKTTKGEILIRDLTNMPHLLIAGATGSGKSVMLNSIIAGLIYKTKPWETKFIMIDLKLVELIPYNGIPYLLYPVITTPRDSFEILKWLEKEVERRYKMLTAIGVRNIKEYNQKVGEGDILPYIVVFIDEYADLILTTAKSVEKDLTRLSSISRAVGIHFIIATQRPSVDIIAGLLKANFPVHIAFRTASATDSRTILGQNGAEKLIGKGDGLFQSGLELIRFQAPFISSEEVSRIVEYLKEQGSPEYVDIYGIREDIETDFLQY